MKTRHFVITAATLMIGTSAFAGTECTTAAQATWMPQVDMLQKLVDSGYTIERFRVTDGNCYAMHGWDKAGKRVEAYFSPVDGGVVKTKTSTKDRQTTRGGESSTDRTVNGATTSTSTTHEG